MRLPSTIPDANELVRTMSLAVEGSERIISADDYLTPQYDDKEPLCKLSDNFSKLLSVNIELLLSLFVKHLIK